MKYHTLLTANNGLNIPSTNPCKLLEFGFLKLGAGETYSSESGDREMLAVLLGGKASFESGREALRESRRTSQCVQRQAAFGLHPGQIQIYDHKRRAAVEIALPSAPS